MRNRIHPERGSSAADFESSPGFTNVQEAWPESESEPNTPDRDEGGHTPRGKPTAVPLLGLPIDSAASDDLQPEPEPEPEPEHRGRAHSQLVGEGQADTAVAFGASLHGAVPHSARSSASGFMATPRLTPRGHHADDNHRHPSCATYYAPRNRNHISLFWEEKLLMAVEFVQVFALMRMLSQTWTWPPFWRRWTRWAVLFNLDLPAFRYADFDDCPPSFAECSASCRSCPSCVADGALCECEAEAAACDAACVEAGDTQPALNLTMCIAGLSGGDPEAEITLDQRPGTSWPMYAAVWLGVVGVLVLGGAYARLSLRRKHSHRRAYYRLTYACLVLSEILYLPALLALPRMFVCAVPFDELFPSITEVGNPYTNHGGAALFASPPLCGSALHALTRCLALAVFLPLLLGFPLTQFNITRRQLVYAEDIAHEMFLRSRELEYLLGLNHHWGAFHYHTFASFQRASAYAKAYSSGGKIVLASTVFMGSGGVGATTAILTVLCLGQLSALVWPRYRCSSSRAVHKTLGWCAICNIGSGWLLSLGVRSFFLVDSHLQYYLIGLNAVGAAFIVLELLTSMCCACRRKPSKYASAETRLGWPVTTHDAQLIRTEQWEWVQAVEEAQELIHSSRDKLPLFVDPLPLHDIIAKVERFVNAAADAGSLLWPTLDECMQDLVILYGTVERRTLLPNPSLEALLPEFAERILQREAMYILTRATKRRILLKLLAMRCFLMAPAVRSRRAALEVAKQAQIGTVFRHGAIRL